MDIGMTRTNSTLIARPAARGRHSSDIPATHEVLADIFLHASHIVRLTRMEILPATSHSSIGERGHGELFLGTLPPLAVLGYKS